MTSRPPAKGQIRSVQALRAIAAIFVVIFHSTVLWHEKFDPSVTLWENGRSGVPLFFVISGFIMVLSSRRLLTAAHGWRRFLELRLVRVVPMYWLVTVAKLASIMAVPAMALHTRPTPWNIVASFLFLPSRDGAGEIRPIVDVGWTLSFEMLFYLVFAAAILAGVEPLLLVGPVMIVLALASIASTPDWPAIATLADPMVLEFVFGVVVARLLVQHPSRSLPSWFGPGLAAVGLLCLILIPTPDGWMRVIVWGLAAAAVLYGSVLGERWIGPRLPDLAVEIGEASYSLYLVHGFVLPVVGVVLAKSGLTGGTLGVALMAGCLVGSIAVSLAVYRMVEVPITTWLRRVVADRGRTPLAAPESPI